MPLRTIVIASGLCLALHASIAAGDESGTQVTIYNGGFASVKERRSLDLRKCTN
jgi:hypothetical protein